MLRRSAPVTLATLFGAYFVAYIPWVAFTTTLYVAMERRRARLAEPGVVGRLFVASLLLFFLPDIAWQVFFATARTAAEPFAAFVPALRRWPAELWLLDLMMMTASFVVVHAIVSIREGRAIRDQQRAADAERLELRLELEQQRLRGIRAQLEPHFLFNALSAIAGLVRDNKQRVAVDAIGQLSTQLRHAVASSQKDWSTIGEELEFVRGYIALQGLRYPDRLQVLIEAPPVAEPRICPPMILQPLVENAIRHDVECHEGQSTIHVVIMPGATTTTITVSNTVHAEAPANPGLGLGLRALRDRLGLLYGTSATLDARRIDEHFVVTLLLPSAPVNES